MAYSSAPKICPTTSSIWLREVMRYNLAAVRAYLLKEEFQDFWGYDSPTWARKFLDQCLRRSCDRVSRR